MDGVWVGEVRQARLDAYRRGAAWIHGHENFVKLGAALLLAILTGGLAQVAVHTPLTPVPYSLQVFGVCLMGGLLGRNWGTASAAMYVLLGLIGLPVFAGDVEKAGGLATALDQMKFLGGIAVFQTKLSAGYIVGFVAQAFIIGSVVDRRTLTPRRRVPLTAAAAGLALVGIAVLDAYLLANYAALYPNSPTPYPNAWFALVVAGEAVLLGGTAWIAFTTKARRERIELFLGNVAALLVLYLIGAAWFWVSWTTSSRPTLGLLDILRYTVVPFIPADLTKILLAIGLLTLLRPTRAELERATGTPNV